MDNTTFKRVLTSFADTPGSVDFSKGKLVCEIQDKMIEATLQSRDGELWVNEHGEEMAAHKWILQRVARLPILAERISSAFEEPENFITPKADSMSNLDELSAGKFEQYGDATTLTLELLDRRPGGCSSVVYLTSDAGEGKTTLMRHLARLQAERFKAKQSDWLLVPIELAGKPLLSFDDLVIGFLSNRLRFPLFYFDAFMEMVKLGVIVPAFDGFEEMWVQTPQGDALSAIGSLMGTMDSAGTVLIAARKAYFEYQDVRAQARLFDSIGNSAVVFSRVAIQRWNEPQFLQYCEKRGISNGREIFSRVAERLKPDHPLLTRAVLIKRLLDVAQESGSLAQLLQEIGNSPVNYFAVFVKAIVEREAREKWINTKRDPHVPLLTVDEHFELLATVAQEMWTLSTDNLKGDVLDLLTDLFCEARKLDADVTFQIRERTKQHALIVGAPGARKTFSFDHEEFKNFFLGESVGQICRKADPTKKLELLGILRKATLPSQAVDAALATIRKSKSFNSTKVTAFLQEVAGLDGPTSFTRENVARLLLRVLHRSASDGITFVDMSFGVDALRHLELDNVTFNQCLFAPTSLEDSILKNCKFSKCHFDQLILHSSMKILKSVLDSDEGEIGSILPSGAQDPVYDPSRFGPLLQRAGFEIPKVAGPVTTKVDEDQSMKMFRRLIRQFQYGSRITEPALVKRLGPLGGCFVKEVVPQLVKAGVLALEWSTAIKQEQYRLNISMERIYEALRISWPSVDHLVAEITRPTD